MGILKKDLVLISSLTRVERERRVQGSDKEGRKEKEEGKELGDKRERKERITQYIKI